MESLERVLRRIDDAAATSAHSGEGAAPAAVKLMLAVKRQSTARIIEAARALEEAGRPVLLGHNQVQEARATIPEVRRAVPSCRVHLIGHLQSNKINQALGVVDAVDTVDSAKLASALAQRVSAAPLGVFMQVNTSGEATKSGIAPAGALALAEHIASLPQLRLDGLMTIGAHTDSLPEVVASFRKLASLRETIRRQIPTCTELSMGMSSDMEIAIGEGATIVRIGTDVFGARVSE